MDVKNVSPFNVYSSTDTSNVLLSSSFLLICFLSSSRYTSNRVDQDFIRFYFLFTFVEWTVFIFQKKNAYFFLIIITISPFPKKLSKGVAAGKKEGKNHGMLCSYHE